MLNILAGAYLVFFGIYAFGEQTRKNPKIDAFFSTLEGRYSQLNGLLEELTIREGLIFLRRLYGWLFAAILFSSFFIQRFSPMTPQKALPFYSAFFITFMGWFSIKWVIAHKKTISETARNNVLIALCPLFLGIVDYFSHSTITQTLIFPLYKFFDVLHIAIPEITNPLALGSIMSLMMVAFFGFHYVLAWLVATPIFLLSVVTILLPVWFAQRVAKLGPQNKFAWFAVILMAIATMYLARP